MTKPFITIDAPINSWWTLTGLGDTILMGPAVVLIWLALVLGFKSHGLTLRWMLTWAVVGLIVLATKLAYTVWGLQLSSIDFIGFSGHAVCAAIVWPTLFWLLVAGRSVPHKGVAISIGYLLAVAIAVSRIVLSTHSKSESIAGLALGTIAAVWFLRPAWRAVPVFPHVAAAMPVLVVLLAFQLHGLSAPTGVWLMKAVEFAGVDKPFYRMTIANPFSF